MSVCKLLKISVLFALGLLVSCSGREQWEESERFAARRGPTCRAVAIEQSNEASAPPCIGRDPDGGTAIGLGRGELSAPNRLG